MIKSLIPVLESSERVLIVSHRDPDGDALGASLGLAHLLLGQGKEVFVHSVGRPPPEYRFLPGLEMVSGHLPGEGWADLAALLDCHQLDRVGQAAREYLLAAPRTVVIDHHEGPVDFGHTAWVDPTLAATCQMVALLAVEADWALNPDTASNLFVGLQTDTGRFQYSNTTPLVFKVAATLVEAGAEPWPISQEIYSTRPMRVRLLARILESAEMLCQGRLAVASVTQKDLQALGAAGPDLEHAVEALRGIPGVHVSALLRETSDAKIKLSLRSRGGLDVAAIAHALGGGGHKSAAGARLDGSLAAGRAEVVGELLRAMERN